jgi:hypothetical protein
MSKKLGAKKRGDYVQGEFTPRNKDKYKGNHFEITYRSSWEKRLMAWFDKTPNVLLWSSEEIIVCYKDPMGQQRRYFPDFYAKIKDKNGTIKEYLIEVKPYKQTIEPKPKDKISKNYINEVYTWGVNNAKWEAAKEYCKKKNWVFKVMTEKELFGKSFD